MKKFRAKVKVNLDPYGARGRVNIGIFLTDPTLWKKVKCMICIGKWVGSVGSVPTHVDLRT